MSKLLLSLAAALAVAVPSIALACPGMEGQCDKAVCAARKAAAAANGEEAPSCHGPHGKEAKTTVSNITVEELAAIPGEKVAIIDANGPETRAKMGVIPNAVLLTSSSKFELSELPSDKSKKLVFYCANTRCTAAPSAAEKAAAAGYTDVQVLSAGIMGWKEAGKATSKPQS